MTVMLEHPTHPMIDPMSHDDRCPYGYWRTGAAWRCTRLPRHEGRHTTIDGFEF